MSRRKERKKAKVRECGLLCHKTATHIARFLNGEEMPVCSEHAEMIDRVFACRVITRRVAE
jgi:hypothetical protein